MLTRRHIRVKVMQSMYALTKAENVNLEKEEKFLLQSMENMYNLYLTVLSLLIEIQKRAASQLTLSQGKYLATAEDKNPNKKFVNNEVLQMLVNNQLLQEAIEDRKLNSWYLDEEYVKIIYNDILNSDIYKDYMKEKLSTFKEDKEFLVDVFKEIIAPNEKLYDYIEDHKITWIDDLPAVNTIFLKSIRKLKSNNHPETYFLPSLFKDEEDKKFGIELLRKTVLNNEMLQEEINGKTPNWDSDRIADMDTILLKMAICEFLKFPSIPIKVTINEYLEIAKEYSTPKSSIFVNGILDKLVKDYQTTQKLNKVGRGLL
ncbi:NusB antitermination factor [Pustulibacterium marinum]|uniref:NusB antitermination factor n=1 Tax=Pustulibacterium marinum TaxID=1224947 RepID=A0A1I7G682_9FLAO|nr:transcription antitermination factor NusB [Pustulibacterium marinum]SFU43746.1 NusB antitermination factor [Pustulibacterium marinum]